MAGKGQEIALKVLAAAGVTGSDTVLDVACGPGLLACAFAGAAKHVTGIDITPAMIDQARGLQQKKNLSNMTWQLGDVLSLPYPDSSFSIVVSRFSFHHFAHPEAVFGEMGRVCAPGGTIVVADLAVPHDKMEAFNRMEKLRDPSHTRTLTPARSLEMAEKLGLRDIRTQFHRLEMELEAQIKASFPNPGDDDRIRKLLRDDIGKDSLGVDAYLKGNEIHFSYPVLILTGMK